MQLIAVDIGNSSVKVGFAADDAQDDWQAISILDDEQNPAGEFEHLPISSRPVFWSISSVNRVKLTSLSDWIETNRPRDFVKRLSHADIKLAIEVESADKTGVDRLVAAQQAVRIHGGGPLVVIDSGTAVTIDFIDGHSVFQGGLIFPGAESCFDALARGTDALPDLSNVPLDRLLENQSAFVGKSTASAIQLGVFQCQLQLMRAAVEFHQKKTGEPLPVFVTGGGITQIKNWLPPAWRVIPDLVLQGARTIGRSVLESETPQ